MAHRKKTDSNPYSDAFIEKICALYDDRYDDRIEDSKPPSAGKKGGIAKMQLAGADWQPGIAAEHKSLSAFQKELLKIGVRLSTSKIRKILISGGAWTTERSREVQTMFSALLHGSPTIKPDQAVAIISEKLDISRATVTINLPYLNGVNGLDHRSPNALRCARYREKKKGNCEYGSPLYRLKSLSPSRQEDELWNILIERQTNTYTTSGRGSIPGKPFTYTIRGGEMFVSLKEKSLTKATVMMAFRKALEVQENDGFVKGPKRLGTFGASYLYAIFLRLGFIQSEPKNR